MTEGIAYLAAIALAAVFTYSAVAKFRDPHPARRALRAAGLPGATARGVAFAELVIALALLAVPAAGAVAALVMLVAFTGFVAFLLARRIDVSCGCFGASATQPVSLVDVVRNVFLAALALGAMGTATPSGVALEEVILATTFVALGAVALAAMATRRNLGQLFDNRMPGDR